MLSPGVKKTILFLIFSGGSEKEKWHEMGNNNVYTKILQKAKFTSWYTDVLFPWYAPLVLSSPDNLWWSEDKLMCQVYSQISTN